MRVRSRLKIGITLMRKAAWRALVAFAVTTSSAQADHPLYIFGGDGHKDFLGCLNCGETHPKSVWNEMSQFGFKNNFGVWNPFGQYLNPFSSYSMCNEFASDPPVIVDDQGNAYGRMSLNQFAPGSVCSATGSEKLCHSIRIICEAH
jgi:hypothetical protein